MPTLFAGRAADPAGQVAARAARNSSHVRRPTARSGARLAPPTEMKPTWRSPGGGGGPHQAESLVGVAPRGARTVHDDRGAVHRRLDSRSGGQVADHELGPLAGRVPAAAGRLRITVDRAR